MKKLVMAVAAMFAASLFADGTEPPANDNMQNAEVISGESGSTKGTCDGATSDGDDDPVYDWGLENSVWYRWKAPATGNFKFDTEGSEADTVLFVCSINGTRIASNDDIDENADNYASRVFLQAKAGTEYLIGIGTYIEGVNCEMYYDEERDEWLNVCEESTIPPFVLNWYKAGDTGTLKISAEPYDDESAGGTVKGAGSYKIGTKVTLKATPNKGSAFAGWYIKATKGEDAGEFLAIDYYLDEETDWRNTSFPYVVDSDDEVEIIARFATADEDSALSILIGEKYWDWVCDDEYCEEGHWGEVSVVEYESIKVDGEQWTYYVVDGKYLPACLCEECSAEDAVFRMWALDYVDSISLPKLTVKGLPPGLKYDSKTGVISGKATKPGVYKVAFSVTNASVKKPVVKEIDFIVPNQACSALPNLETDTYAYGMLYAGTAIDPELVDCTAEGGWTVKVAGLPAGLSYKDGQISGIPTKAGVYTVTFTASKKGELPQTATITLNVSTVPDWAKGIFTGWVYGYYYSGFATITVGDNGKTSGKVSFMGTNYNFTASGYSEVGSYSDFAYDEATGAEEFFSVVEYCGISGELKAGKAAIPVSFWIHPFAEEELPLLEDGELANAYMSGGLADNAESHEDGERRLDFDLYRNMWKDRANADAAKAELAKWEGVYTLSMYADGYLSVTVGKDGTVKASGKLGDGTAFSATSPLMYDPWRAEGYFAAFYASPSAYNGGYFRLQADFGTERGAIGGYGEWINLNAQATGEYGEGYESGVEPIGAYYDKTEKLSGYYDTLRFRLSDEDAPPLLYQFKETYLDEDTKKKVSESYIAVAYAAGTLDQDGSTVAVTDKGFTVAKATKPVQDKKTKEWTYNGANDGALSLSFTQATGIFKGSYTFWYDYMSAYDDTKEKETISHTSKKVNIEGVWVQGYGLNGFFAWEDPATYVDAKTKKEKSYKYKTPFGVVLVPAAP